MRPLASYVRNVPRAHLYLWWFARAFRLFRHPMRFLGHYLRRTSPESRFVEMRDGTRIALSGHAHDVITLFVNFAQENYGRFRPGGTVVDIGANLGAFSLFAARSGARQVYAYEPNAAAFRCLDENVRMNALQEVVHPRRLAVGREPGALVRFPVAPSAYNRAADDGASGDFDTVETTSLPRILDEAGGSIDLLKLDCEGAEYEILLHANSCLERVREIRMEYHLGRARELVEHLRRSGFEITRLAADNPRSGSLWACNRRLAP